MVYIVCSCQWILLSGCMFCTSLLLVSNSCCCIVDTGSEDERKSSKMPRSKAEDEGGVSNAGNTNGGAISAPARDGGFLDRGSIDGVGPSDGRPMGEHGPTASTGMGECELDVQGDNSNCGESGRQQKIHRGKLRERTALEALLLPRTKRRRVDPESAEKENGCSSLTQQTAASKSHRRSGKRRRGELG